MADHVVRWAPLAMVCGLLAWMADLAASPISDPDAWWHLRLGNDLIAQHSLAAPDHWSSFATVRWVPTEPLPEVVSAYVERWAGLPGLAVLFGVFLFVFVGAVQLSNRREAALLPATIATLLTVPAATLSLTPRPQVLSFVLLPVVLAAWLQTERDLKPRWWLVPLVWFWSLCHGFWVFGPALGLVFVCGIALSRRTDLRTLARLSGVACGSLAVVALNPVGLGVLEAPFAVHSTAHYISEWQRTDLLTAGPLSAAVLIVSTGVMWALTRETITWSRLFLLAVSVVLLWYAVRLVPVAALVAAPLFASALDAVVVRSGGSGYAARRIGRFEVLTIAAATAVSSVGLGFAAPHTSASPGHVPLGLDSALDRLPPGTRVFDAYGVGGWLTWRHPELDQYIDGLTTSYSEAHVRDYLRADATGPGWYGIVLASQAPIALLDAGGGLAAGLARKGWTSEGRSDGYVLLRRP